MKKKEFKNRIEEVRKDFFKQLKVITDEYQSKHCEYKVGDYVITKGYREHYDGIPLKILKIDKDLGISFCYFSVFENAKEGFCHGSNFEICRILRHATPEEIAIAKLIPKGVECLVQDEGDDDWYLRVSDGKGKFAYIDNSDGKQSWDYAKIIEKTSEVINLKG